MLVCVFSHRNGKPISEYIDSVQFTVLLLQIYKS